MFRGFFTYIRRQADLERERWSLWYTVFFGSGIGFYFSLSAEPSKWISLAIVESIILLALLLKKHHRILRVIGLCSIFVLGFCWIQIRTLYLSTYIYHSPITKTYLQGRINKIDFNSKGNVRLTLDNIQNFEQENINGRYKITLRQKQPTFKSGQCVEMVAELKPNIQAQIPYGYQFNRHNFYQGISGNGYSLSPAYPIECKSDTDFFTNSINKINNLRSLIVRHIHKILPQEEASIVSAILAGEQSGIKSTQLEKYRNSGLAHFLSISGMHMSLIAGIMFFLIRLIMAAIPKLSLRFDSKKVAVGFTFIISTVYLLISGIEIPAQRAFIMTTIVLLGVLFNRRAISMKSISLAALLVLIITPEALIGASFQMSFAAVVALIAFYEKISVRLNNWLCHRDDNFFIKTIKIITIYIVGIILADLIASLATLPFAIYHFNRISIYTTITNLLSGPIIGLIIMPFTLFALILIPFGLDIPFLYIIGYGVKILNDITSFISSQPEASLQVLSMPTWGLVLIVLGGLWLCIWEHKWRWWGIIPIIIGFSSLYLVQKPDILIGANNNLVAVKSEENNMIVLPAVGNNFTKHLWLEKTASNKLTSKQKKELKQIWQGQRYNPEWLDLKCNQYFCIYKNIVRITKEYKVFINNKTIDNKDDSVAIYLNPKLKVIYSNDITGKRIWNKKYLIE
ncbi:MAG: ComEC family competence protein [Alphaproteobacteria bacterium]|nr:ComEC family competence protein [Alphaproteobacteria bacterium]